MAFSPWHSFFRSNLDLILRRLHFPKDRIGEVIPDEEGRPFTVFREMIRDPAGPDVGPPGAAFQVRFHVAGMTPGKNKIFSLFTIPFFAGLPGFRSKLWLLDEASGFFMGRYRWQTVDDARRYSTSFAMRFMTRRSDPGTATFDIREIETG